MVIKLQGFETILTFGGSHLFKVLRGHLATFLAGNERLSQRALRLPIGINLSKHKLLIFYIFLLATLHECNFLAILGCP